MTTLADLGCHNPGCPDFGRRGAGNLRHNGHCGKARTIPRWQCRTCLKSFSERRGTVLEHRRIPEAKAIAVLDHAREGVGMRATARLVGVHGDPVTRLVRKSGAHAERAHDARVALSPPEPRDPA